MEELENQPIKVILIFIRISILKGNIIYKCFAFTQYFKYFNSWLWLKGTTVGTGSSSRAPALQEQSPECKPHSQPPKNVSECIIAVFILERWCGP
jgi:hypothetical protein